MSEIRVDTISEKTSGSGTTVSNLKNPKNPFRNLIINGDMQVAQRATSTTGVANDSDEGYNSLDRFGLYYFGNEGGAATMSQDTTVPSDTSYGVQKKSLKVDVTTADTSIGATGIIALKQTVEAQYIHHSGWNFTSSSSKITLSFWARSVKAGTYCVLFRCHDASGERYFVKEYTLVADTWKHVEMVVPGDSNLVFNADNGEGLEVRWILAAGDDRNDATADTWYAPGSAYENSTSNQVNFYDSTDNNFFLTGVQLEVGEIATDFEHLPHDVQLQRCQRYCAVLGGTHETTATFGTIGVGYVTASTQAFITYQHIVPMRGLPSETTSADSHFCLADSVGSVVACTGIAINQAGSDRTLFLATTAGSLTAARPTTLLANNNASATLTLDAEL